MHISGLERKAGEFPLPFPVNYAALLPAEVAGRQDVNSLLNITTNFGGDVAHATELFDGVRSPLIASEAEILLRAGDSLSSRRLGIADADIQQLRMLYILGKASGNAQSGFQLTRPMIITNYFIALHNVLSGRSPRILKPNAT